MNIFCLFGIHKRKLVHTRPTRMSMIFQYEWYECERCDHKLFTADGNIHGNDKWKDVWHKTPEEDNMMYDSNGQIKEDGIKAYYERRKKEWGKKNE